MALKRSARILLDRTITRMMNRRVVTLTEQVRELDANALRAKRAEVRQLSHGLSQFLSSADEKLRLPRVGNQMFPRPENADWAWRPGFWCAPLSEPGLSSVGNGAKLGQDMALFHDCPHREITLQQVQNLRESDLAAMGMQLDVFRFAGTYLSVVIELPASALKGLTKQHIFRVSTKVEMEKPLEIYARLNVMHGPNTEQIVQELPTKACDILADFDLAFTDLNEAKVQRGWLDLIFENPMLNQVVLRDLTLCRYRRAQF